MKRKFGVLVLLFVILVTAVGCGEKDYFPFVSELKSDLFFGETQTFSVEIACVEREVPLLSDGVCGKVVKLMEISLVDKAKKGEYTVLLEKENFGGELGYRTLKNDYYYSRSVENFPEKSVTVKVTYSGGEEELVLTSVKTEDTLSPQEALKKAVETEKELFSSLTDKNGFLGEIKIKLLRRNDTFYYVAVIDRDGNCTSLLLDKGTGEVLARHGSKK